jgi:CDP-6-deoxy-D-xylo-4-hexulose-3-dehydrase
MITDHRYVFSEVGYNLKPTEIQGSIGLEQLNKINSMDKARRNNFKKLLKIFKQYERYFYLPKTTNKSDPCWFSFLLTVREDSPFTREEFVSYLESNKIQTRGSYFTGNCLFHPAYQNLASKYEDVKKEFPIATLSTTNSFFLGTFIGITKEKMNYIEKIVNQFFFERGLNK